MSDALARLNAELWARYNELVDRYEAVAFEQSAALTSHLLAQQEELRVLYSDVVSLRRYLDGSVAAERGGAS